MPPTASPAKQRISRPWRFRRNGAMRCDTAFRLVAGGCLEEVATYYKALRAGDANALHQTRIALTRLRAAISFYSPMVADSEWLRLKSELKWLNGYLGATRDLDVAIANCQRNAEKQMFRAARAESQRRLNRALGSARYRRWLNDLSDWIGNGPWSAIEDPRAIRERELSDIEISRAPTAPVAQETRQEESRPARHGQAEAASAAACQQTAALRDRILRRGADKGGFFTMARHREASAFRSANPRRVERCRNTPVTGDRSGRPIGARFRTRSGRCEAPRPKAEEPVASAGRDCLSKVGRLDGLFTSTDTDHFLWSLRHAGFPHISLELCIINII